MLVRDPNIAKILSLDVMLHDVDVSDSVSQHVHGLIILTDHSKIGNIRSNRVLFLTLYRIGLEHYYHVRGPLK